MSLRGVAIFGMGRFGRSLAGELEPLGLLRRVGGRGRNLTGNALDAHHTPAEFLDGLEPGTLVVMSVRDDGIEEVAAEFAAQPSASQYGFVHTSGSSGLGVLQPLSAKGVNAGVFHILQSLPAEHRPGTIAGSYAAIAGPDELLPQLQQLAAVLKVAPVRLREDQWVAYHAAAVLASNALLGLLESGREILAAAGVPLQDAGRMLLPLVQGTLRNASEFELTQALTGPVVRGDVGTIRRHLEVLQGAAREDYKAVIRAVVRLAERSGRVPPEKLQQISDLVGTE